MCHDSCVTGVPAILDEGPECAEALSLYFDCFVEEGFDCESQTQCEDEFEDFFDCVDL